MRIDELRRKLSEALSNEEDYPEGLYIALHGEGMLDSQMIENEINAVSGRE